MTLTALITGFLLDATLGDPACLPHPVVGFGKLIGWFEKTLNRGSFRFVKGMFITILLVGVLFTLSYLSLALLEQNHPVILFIINSFIVFFCLSALTLRKEVKLVFEVLHQSLEKGRNQVARIVGRDTRHLNSQQIRTAALETLAENLSDGVIAPLFWFALLGAPGMLSYKMINTLDSMIGYKNERYKYFGKFAARLDDVTNYIPARLTALLMLLVSGNLSKTVFVASNGNKHTSPNSGYPEAALAGILSCRFGGPNNYFGEIVSKPYIGTTDKTLDDRDLKLSLAINRRCEISMLLLVCLTLLIPTLF
ncbi:MAG: adenosylcobinamide-phosphate synthase CbiB [Bacteroidota bacterium]|nr:adenosylcobinamide-phosphate synthase CbiB [Bacteroidota bacterium]